MDSKLLNKAITISAKEEKLQAGKPVVKLKDEKGLTYTVYKLKQDGTESVAWGQLSDLSLGDTVQIGYVEDQGEYEGKAVTYRTIRTLSTDIAQGMTNASAQIESPRSGANNASQGASNDDFWEKKAYKQCLWGYFLELRTHTDNPYLTESDMTVVWDNFKKIEKDADKRFSVSDVRTEPTEGQQKLDDELGEDIPF